MLPYNSVVLQMHHKGELKHQLVIYAPTVIRIHVVRFERNVSCIHDKTICHTWQDTVWDSYFHYCGKSFSKAVLVLKSRIHCQYISSI